GNLGRLRLPVEPEGDVSTVTASADEHCGASSLFDVRPSAPSGYHGTPCTRSGTRVTLSGHANFWRSASVSWSRAGPLQARVGRPSPNPAHGSLLLST